MKVAKYKNLFFVIVFLLLNFAMLLSTFAVQSRVVKAQTGGSNLQQQLAETENRLKELKAQKDAINAQIIKEQQSQSSLQQQTKNIDRAIQQNELQIETLQVEIEKLNLEVAILKEEKSKLESRLAEVQSRLGDLQTQLQTSLNLLYKMSLSSKGFLEGNVSYEDSVIDEERQRSTVRLIKADLNEVKSLEAEVTAKRDEIAAKEKETTDLQTQMQTQADNLGVQVSALQWQKNNKQKLLAASQQNQNNLDSQKKVTDQKIAEYEAVINNIRTSLIYLPPSGTRISAGQVIGFQGRSGLSCDPYDPSLVPTKTNHYCEQYGYTGPDWYYYPPEQFPTKGSHLHFEYFINNKKVYPYDFLFGASKGEFKAMPLMPTNFSRGSHEGGAIDLVSSHGAPVFAVKPGYISYYCINYPPVPGFTDPAFGAVVQHVNEAGQLDGTISQYWHMIRGNRPCNYR